MIVLVKLSRTAAKNTELVRAIKKFSPKATIVVCPDDEVPEGVELKCR